MLNRQIIKKTLSERSLNKALYQILFNAVNDAIVLVDIKTGSFVEVNDKFCEMTGFSCQEARGMPFAALFTGEFPYTDVQAREHIEKALTEGPSFRVAGPGPERPAALGRIKPECRSHRTQELSYRRRPRYSSTQGSRAKGQSE